MIKRFRINICKFFFAIMPICLTASHASAGREFSFGMGMGYFYNGLGVNLALKSPYDFKYLGTGVSGFKGTSSGSNNDSSSEYSARYGVTAGWVRTDIIAKESDKHGLGFSLSVDDGKDFDTMLSLGPSYTYFFRGVSRPGFNLGLAPGLGFTEDHTYWIISIQIGYQF
jgi:hypothetical protein